jgi:hypothetical protein
MVVDDDDVLGVIVDAAVDTVDDAVVTEADVFEDGTVFMSLIEVSAVVNVEPTLKVVNDVIGTTVSVDDFVGKDSTGDEVSLNVAASRVALLISGSV